MPKKPEIPNFELKNSYIPQKKADNIYNKDSTRKVIFLTKKSEFFRFFHFLPKARGPLKIFDVPFSTMFRKNIKKCLHWDLSDIEWNKVMDFGEAIPIPLDTADGFTVGRDD